MADAQEIRVPDIGDFDAVDVVEVLVAPGDTVEVDQGLITLESDKASLEVPSTVAGKVVEVKVSVGDQVGEGDVVALVEASGGDDDGTGSGDADRKAADGRPDGSGEADRTRDGGARKEAAPEEAAPDEGDTGDSGEDAAAQRNGDDRDRSGDGGDRGGGRSDADGDGDLARLDEDVDEESFGSVYASPSIRRLARELGVDLGRVPGTGRKDRIVHEDVVRYVRERLGGSSAEPSPAAAGGFSLPEMPTVDFSKFGPTETVELHRIRKLSARNLHRSWLHVPHVTQHEEADITEMEAFRKNQGDQAKQQGVKLTPLAFLLKATATALRDFPDLRSSLHPDGERLIVKNYFHVGVAVDTPNGLVVPVIRDVDSKGILALAGELGDVSSRAREGKLAPKDFQGAVFTISSLGGIGGTAFTPIVNAPEVGILGVARAKWSPVWNGEDFEPRLMLPFSLSYDHRVIDGAQACRFVVHLAQLLGDLRRLLL